MQCANCSNVSVFKVDDPGAMPVHYCAVCLPVHMRTRASAGHFDIKVEEVIVVEEPTPEKNKTATKKKVTSESNEN
jgi:hypothetical protein